MKLISNKILSITCSLLLLCGVSSCYDTVLEYEDTTVINSSDGSVSSDTLSTSQEAEFMLRTVQTQVVSAAVHLYQMQYTLHIIDYAGYMSIPHSFDGNMYSSFMFYDSYAFGQTEALEKLAPNAIPIINSGKKLGIEPLSALASVLFSYSIYQNLVTYGPVPYSDFRALKEQRPLTYEKQSDVFKTLFIELQKADSTLEAYQRNPTAELDKKIEGVNYISEDKITSATDIVKHWRKFTNSMILRLAMTVVNVPDFNVNGKTAQTLAEEAVTRGILQPGDPQVGLRSGADGPVKAHHPLYLIANSWVDARLNATLHNIMKRTNHPALTAWFAPNNGRLVSKFNKVHNSGEKIMSMRSGTYLSNSSLASNNYILFSKFVDLAFAAKPVTLFKVEEALFLQAEGALRGWNMRGTAQSFYEAGIQESFTQNDFSGYSDYMAWRGAGDMTVSGDFLYEDPYDPDNDLTSDEKADYYFMLNNGWGGIDTNPYTSVTADKEKEYYLEKIMTQKWLALFPMSLVAWTDIRRTGYPKLLPAVYGAYGEADGSISDELTIRRIPFATGGVDEAKSDFTSTGVPNLDAETTGSVRGDMQGTRLWWDVEKTSNF